MNLCQISGVVRVGMCIPICIAPLESLLFPFHFI
jgi:hypothetical protein